MSETVTRPRYVVLDGNGHVTMYGTAQVDASGSPAAFLQAMNATEVDEATYQAIYNGGRWQCVNGTYELIPPPTPAIETIRADATRRIDAAAEAARLSFITRGAGQALEYAATEAEARAAVAAADPLDANDYPWLTAELNALTAVGVTTTLRGVAESVVAQADGWKAVGAQIKELRRAAKMAIAAETDPVQIESIVRGVSWPAPGG